MQQDSRGNDYEDAVTARVTSIPQTWEGSPGIRIQAYKGTGKELHMGAEIPIPDRTTAYEFLRAVFVVIENLNLPQSGGGASTGQADDN